MSNAYIRAHLEKTSAPVVAWLIDGGYVDDDCGILNAKWSRNVLREGLMTASRAVQNMQPTPVPPMRVVRERL